MPDIADNQSTTATLVLGDIASSTIDFAGDSDWFAIELTAGQLIEIKVQDDPANTFDFDTLMNLRNANGFVVVSNDDFGTSLESRLLFEVVHSGTLNRNDAFMFGHGKGARSKREQWQ